jgi:hypothetical protein
MPNEAIETDGKDLPLRRDIRLLGRILGDLGALYPQPFPYLDPLNHTQIEVLNRKRAGDASDDVGTGLRLTINGLAAGLHNNG